MTGHSHDPVPPSDSSRCPSLIDAARDPSEKTANRSGKGPEPIAALPGVDDETTTIEEGTELERLIGLSGALAIGIGAMIGAGMFEDRARRSVDTIAETFRGAGCDPETRLAFSHDRDQTIERVATAVGATATVLPNPAGEIRDVLVPLRGVISHSRLADLVAALLAGSDRSVTLWGIDTGSEGFDAEAALAEARARLDRRSLPSDQVDVEYSTEETPLRATVERSDAFDAIVMGAGDPSLCTAFLCGDEERVAEGAVSPVLVVRNQTD